MSRNINVEDAVLTASLRQLYSRNMTCAALLFRNDAVHAVMDGADDYSPLIKSQHTTCLRSGRFQEGNSTMQYVSYGLL